jgi:O-antigen ligase/tetratricopeptide (TPR) repeat protein
MEQRMLKRMSAAMSWRSAVLVMLVVSLTVPLLVPSGFFFPYVAPRNIFFRVITELATLVLIVALCFGDDDLDLRYEPIFWAIAMFIGAEFVSAFFSPARDHSFFGDFERMGGVWGWAHLGLFFLLLRTLRDDDWKWMLNAVIIVSVAVSGTAIFEHTQLASSARFSGSMLAASSGTIGNSGLLGGYLLFGIGIASYLASTSGRLRFLYLGAAGVDLAALAYSENRSSFIGLVLAAVIGSIVFSLLHSRKRRWLVPTIAAGVAAIVLGGVGMVRAFPSSAIATRAPVVVQRLALTNPSGVDESRLMQWRAAIQGFVDRPLLGYGPENHDLVWSAHFDPAIYHIDTDVYDRAHNQFLETLATTGVIGTLAFFGIWLAIGVTLVRAYRDDRLSAATVGILVGTQIAYAAFLFFWFFDLNSSMLWIMTAALIASRENPLGVVRPSTVSDAPSRRPAFAVALAAVVVVAVALYSEAYVPTRANRALARIDSFEDPIEEGLSELDLLAKSPSHETAHTPMMMGEYLDWLRRDFPEIRRNPVKRRMLETAFAEALATFRKEIHRDTLNDRLYTHEASTLLAAADFYGSTEYVDTAIDALHKSIELSPRRLQPRMILASIYMDNGEYQSARATLDDAIRVDPGLGEPRYRLAEEYLRSKKSDSAFVMLEASLRRGYVGAPETYLTMGKRLEFAGKPAEAARLYSAYLEAKYTKAVWDGAGTIDRVVPKADIAVAAHLPLLYVRARESELAIKTAAALSAFDSSRTDIVEQFVTDVGARRRARWVAKNTLLPCGPMRAAKSSASEKLDACQFFRRKL